MINIIFKLACIIERFFKFKFWKQLNQRTKILLQKTNIAVHHEVETVYSLWQAFLPTTDVTPVTSRYRHKESTYVAELKNASHDLRTILYGTQL